MSGKHPVSADLANQAQEAPWMVGSWKRWWLNCSGRRSTNATAPKYAPTQRDWSRGVC